jgi:hypothetical protein
MSTRRDFLAFTLGAIAGQSILVVTGHGRPEQTAAVGVDPFARAEMQRRFLLVFRQLGEAEQVALLNGMQRHADGLPLLEAMRGVYVELGRTPPPGMLERFA